MMSVSSSLVIPVIGSVREPWGVAGLAGPGEGSDDQGSVEESSRQEKAVGVPTEATAVRPCAHNKWKKQTKKRGKLVLRCEVCQAVWKTRPEMHQKCPLFVRAECTLGDDCPHPHIYARREPAKRLERAAPAKAVVLTPTDFLRHTEHMYGKLVSVNMPNLPAGSAAHFPEAKFFIPPQLPLALHAPCSFESSISTIPRDDGESCDGDSLPPLADSALSSVQSLSPVLEAQDNPPIVPQIQAILAQCNALCIEQPSPLLV
ncbi:hypothetical protein DIPPA_30439 [Diplonema papillatum]|nr:hypothetical protein DIPPA_30439 [Diplonema papillatum]